MLEEIIRIAHEAGDAILEYYRQDEEVEISRKDDNSPLTKADLASHHVIMKGLQALDPETPVISEESGIPAYSDRKNWTSFWIVDPLDGTKEFIKKNGEFTVNIARIEDGVPVLGIVYIPDKDITYFAQKGGGAFKQVGQEEPQRIFSEASSKTDHLTAVQSRSHGSDTMIDQLAQKGLQVTETIPAGSSLKFCLVAEGSADIYPRMGPTMEWDVAAGDAVYRYSAREGAHASPLTYNKSDLKNGSFIIGLGDESVKF